MARDVKEMRVCIPLEGYTKQKSTAEFTNTEKTYEFPDDNIVTVSQNVSVSLKSWSTRAPSLRKQLSSCLEVLH